MIRPRYVLLDRDGVINVDSDQFIKSPNEWIPIDGSLEAIALLNRFGYHVAVVTNQSGLARGLLTEKTLEEIHTKMHALVKSLGGRIDGVYYCPHGPESDCRCRKPRPGLLEAFAAERQIPLEQVLVIGDSLRDLQAALAVGAQPILVKTGKGRKTHANHPELDVPVFENLWEAAQYITSTFGQQNAERS